VVSVAAERPEVGGPMSAGRRRWMFTRFPFALVYRIAPDDSLRVLAVAHDKRKPEYWRSRT
jgi:toxin ParE1/3/4